MPKDKPTDEAQATSGEISRKEFEKELSKLQVELTRLQTWVKDKGERRPREPRPRRRLVRNPSPIGAPSRVLPRRRATARASITFAELCESGL
jgi:hypothetical protein